MTEPAAAAPCGESADPAVPATGAAAWGAAPPSRRAGLARRLDWVVAATLAAVLAYYCATPGIFQGKASGDGLFGFFYLPGLVHHRTFDMAPPAGEEWVRVLGREATGRVANPCPVGPVLIWAPTYVLGLGLKAFAGLLVKLPAEALPGQTRFDFWMAGLGSLLAGFAGILLMFRLVARRLGRGAARFGVVGAVLATPLCWYLANQPLYQHACAFFAVTLFLERWDAWRGAMTMRRWAWLGLLGGLGMLMRVQEAVFLLLPGLDALHGAWRDRRRREVIAWVWGAVVLLAAAALAFAPQLLLWRYHYGRLAPPQPPGHMRWGDPALVATIFSTRGGLLPWSPLLYLVLPGLLLARRRLGDLVWRSLLLFGAVWWVNASAWDHWGSWSFGARRFTDLTAVFALGLAGGWAWAAARGRRWATQARAALVAAAVFAVALNGVLMELVRQRRVNSSGALAWSAAHWVRRAHGPTWLAAALDRWGYPFVQPAGWIFALAYRVPPRTFEAVVGNYLVERNWRFHDVVDVAGFTFAETDAFVAEGLPRRPPVGWPAGNQVPAARRVRLLLPAAAREPLRLRVVGAFGTQPMGVRVLWNGTLLPKTEATASAIAVQVPQRLVRTRARANELVLEDLPPGTRLTRLEAVSYTRWWAE